MSEYKKKFYLKPVPNKLEDYKLIRNKTVKQNSPSNTCIGSA